MGRPVGIQSFSKDLNMFSNLSLVLSTNLAIHVDDTPDENILIRLPEACDFIQHAIDSGGKIYVHCMMGVSRSVTVVCAYCKTLLFQSQSCSS